MAIQWNICELFGKAAFVQASTYYIDTDYELRKLKSGYRLNMNEIPPLYLPDIGLVVVLNNPKKKVYEFALKRLYMMRSLQVSSENLDHEGEQKEKYFIFQST